MPEGNDENSNDIELYSTKWVGTASFNFLGNIGLKCFCGDLDPILFQRRILLYVLIDQSAQTLDFFELLLMANYSL